MDYSGRRADEVGIYVILQPHRNTLPIDEILSRAAPKNYVAEAQNLLVRPVQPGEQTGPLQRSFRVQASNFVFDPVLSGSDVRPSISALYKKRLAQEVQDFEMHESCDVVLLPATNETRRERGKRRIVKLAVFDMDSTLIDQEVIDELARFVGKYDDVANITASAMRGEIDFAESLKRRVALLKGVPSEVWEKMKPRLSFAEGARELCRALATLGVIMAVLSGGFTPMAEYVKSELGLHVAHANFLETAPANVDFPFNHLTGFLQADKPIVTAMRKRELLLQLAEEHHVPLWQVLCVGDGANDLDMLNAVGDEAGVAIAFKAKPRVQASAPNKLNSKSLLDILYLFDYVEDEIKKLATGEQI